MEETIINYLNKVRRDRSLWPGLRKYESMLLLTAEGFTTDLSLTKDRYSVLPDLRRIERIYHGHSFCLIHNHPHRVLPRNAYKGYEDALAIDCRQVRPSDDDLEFFDYARDFYPERSISFAIISPVLAYCYFNSAKNVFSLLPIVPRRELWTGYLHQNA